MRGEEDVTPPPPTETRVSEVSSRDSDPPAAVARKYFNSRVCASIDCTNRYTRSKVVFFWYNITTNQSSIPSVEINQLCIKRVT